MRVEGFQGLGLRVEGFQGLGLRAEGRAVQEGGGHPNADVGVV